MTNERKLRLVRVDSADPSARGPNPTPVVAKETRFAAPEADAHEDPSGFDDEPPITAEELEAAAALREALEGQDPFAEALRSAMGPEDLDGADHDALIARALGDEGASTMAEREAGEQLRAELAGEREGRTSGLLIALKNAARPIDLPPEKHDELIAAALAQSRLKRTGNVRLLRPLTVVSLSTLAALAAGVALFLGRASDLRPTVAAPTAALVRTHSTESLFDAATPFPRRGQESARIDRIASARAADLRKNNFTAWGVR